MAAEVDLINVRLLGTNAGKAVAMLMEIRGSGNRLLDCQLRIRFTPALFAPRAQSGGIFGPGFVNEHVIAGACLILVP